jgi:hypothetical protein
MSDIITWSPGITLEEIEKQVIQRAYKHYRENKTVTSNSLGVDVKTLYNKLEKYELDRLEQEKKNAIRQSQREEFLNKARGNPPNNLGIPYSPSQHAADVSSGLRMEPPPHASSQHSVSMPERKEVQEMLSRSTSKSDPKKTR